MKRNQFLAALLAATIAVAASGGGAFASADTDARAAQASAAPTKDKPVVLKGGVSESVSPIATDGCTNQVQEGTTVSLIMAANLNSELSRAGDDVVAMVSVDVKDGDKVVLPGQWCVHGKVTEVEHQRRLGRDGYVTVHFDKLVSPDGKYQIPIDAEASTHESTAKAVAKVVAKDSVFVSKGAVAGAITSVQITGIPLAVASHGYSVAGGAAIGATIGLICALKRKGNIACSVPGDEVKFRLNKPVVLPAFNEQALPSAIPVPHLDNLDIVVEKHNFMPDPFNDKRSRLLRVTFKIDNKTPHAYSFADIAVVSDSNKMYYPYALSMDAQKQRGKRVSANSSEEGTITFGVDSPKHKYWLVLLDSGKSSELTRVPVN